MSSKLEPVTWLRVLVTLAYMKGQTEVRTDVRCTYVRTYGRTLYVRTYVRTYVVRTYVRTVDDVMAIKPNFLASMGYQYFLSYGAPL